MTKFHTSKARGFTLIEMSIVLVIIGLIIGGILKGQEIIESSRQKATITQFDSMRSGTNTFIDRYNMLPGDFSLATTRISTLSGGATADLDGNADGVIGTAAAAAANTYTTDTSVKATAEENVNFFNHLGGAELLGGVTIDVTAPDQAGFGDGFVLPSSPIAGTGQTIIYGPGNGADGRVTHWLRLHKTAGVPTASVSGKRGFEIDLKMDDGLVSSGSVRSAIAAGTNTANDNCAGDAQVLEYDAISDTIACVMIVELLK